MKANKAVTFDDLNFYADDSECWVTRNMNLKEFCEWHNKEFGNFPDLEEALVFFSELNYEDIKDTQIWIDENLKVKKPLSEVLRYHIVKDEKTPFMIYTNEW